MDSEGGVQDAVKISGAVADWLTMLSPERREEEREKGEREGGGGGGEGVGGVRKWGRVFGFQTCLNAFGTCKWKCQIQKVFVIWAFRRKAGAWEGDDESKGNNRKSSEQSQHWAHVDLSSFKELQAPLGRQGLHVWTS